MSANPAVEGAAEDVWEPLADVYDEWTVDHPYDRWLEFVLRRWSHDGHVPQRVADVSCGTGTFTRLLADRGFDVVGVDASAAMLARAEAKVGDRARFVRADVRTLQLDPAVDAAVWLFDSANYLTEPEDLAAALRSISRSLKAEGVLIFDLNTKHKLESFFGNSAYGEDRDNFAFIWKNSWDGIRTVSTYRITIFAREDGAFARRRIVHEQRAYSLEEVDVLLRDAGLECVAVCDDYTDGAAEQQSLRVTIVAKKIRAVQ